MTTTSVLVDKISERVAFERTGIRLYDLALAKLDQRGTWDGGPTRADLEEIRADEVRHLDMLVEVMRELGADPAIATPSAALSALEARGFEDALSEPSTTLAQALHTVQLAELADRDGWDLLIDVADAVGHRALSGRFRTAANDEISHLTKMRSWNRAFALLEAKGDQPTMF